jgi:GNAT superfamily N-acetyltransferase
MLRSAVAQQLIRQHGHGHWSSCPTEASVIRSFKMSRVLVARREDRLVATVRLSTRKPWAIDLACFTAASHAVYLQDLAVAPEAQRQGIGRRMVEEATSVAHGWPSQAIRLDTYDHVAGAGPFYRRCGFHEVGHAIYRGVPLVYFELTLG